MIARPDVHAEFADNLAVRASAIHGVGLFAESEFKAGSFVMRLGGYFVCRAQRLTASILPSTAIGVSDEVILCEVAMGNRDLSDYINHSCMPNVGFRDALTIIAARDIQRGDEITIDYAFWENDVSWRLRDSCRCSATDCRGTITGEDWQRPELAPALSEWASPFIRRRIAHSKQEDE